MYTERRNVYYQEKSVRQKIGLLEEMKLKQAPSGLLTRSYSVKAHDVLEIISTWESKAHYEKSDKRLSKKLSSNMVRQTIEHG